MYPLVPPPAMPTINVVNITYDSITLSWSVGEYVTSSELVWRETGSDGSVTTDEGTSGRIAGNTYTIAGLKINTEYTITVTVSNPAGSINQFIVVTIEKGKYTIAYMYKE